MKRLFRFRTILGAFIMLPVLLVGAAVFFILNMQVESLISGMVSTLGDETLAHVQSEVTHFLETPKLVNQMNAEAILSGRVKPDDAATLRSLFVSRVRYFPSISSLYFGNARGGLIDAGREGPGGPLYTIGTDNFSSGTFRKYATNEQGEQKDLVSSIPDFDARTRPWYKTALDARKAAWTEPFLLFTGQDRAISSVLPVYAKDGSFLGVFSVDIFLSQLNQFLSGYIAKIGGVCFITDRNGTVVASSVSSGVPENLIAETVKRVARAESDTDHSHSDFSYGNERYFVHAVSLPKSIGLDWSLFTVYPQRFFSAKLQATRSITIFIFIFVILLSSALAVYLAYEFSKPLDNLALYAETILKKESDPPPPAGRMLEIENLRVKLVSMRHELTNVIHRLNAEIEERNGANARISALLAEKELILREVHHRIKNDMNVVTSLLSLQADSQEDARVSAALTEAESRVASMMILYDKLYRSDTFLEADAAVYLSDIADELASHMDPEKLVSVEKRLESISFHSSQLMSVGIMVNELLTNSYKYAFPRGNGSIFIGLEKSDGKIVLTVADDGGGIPPVPPNKHGFGLQLIQSLVEQIDGSFSIDRSSGTRATITFPY